MSFVKRNMPVFIIGGLTALVFLIIIGIKLRRDTTGPTLSEVAPEELIAGHTYIRGDPDAEFTVVEVTDVTCLECAQAHSSIKDLYENNRNYVKTAIRHFPQNKEGKKAAAAAHAAGEQNEFWRYIDVLFEGVGEEINDDTLTNYAQLLNMDSTKFKQDIESGDFETLVEDDIKAMKGIGVKKVPTIFLNGKLLEGSTIDVILDQIINAVKEAEERDGVLRPESTGESESDVLEPKATFEPLPQEKHKVQEILEIRFTENGWEPADTIGYIGQTVRWINTTGGEIVLKQVDNKYPEFENSKAIPPGQYYEFELYKTLLWRYTEENSGSWAYIYARPLGTSE